MKANTKKITNEDKMRFCGSCLQVTWLGMRIPGPMFEAYVKEVVKKNYLKIKWTIGELW
jgi:hypothetical protein